MKKAILYTDGACSNNPGMGGWAYILKYNRKTTECSGFEAETTNNKMELMAVIKGLEAIPEKCNVEVYSDSAYVVNAFLDDWISSWLKRKWRNSEGKPVKNLELWQRLVELSNFHKIKWNKVAGHSDDELNNRCDALARGEVASHKEG